MYTDAQRDYRNQQAKARSKLDRRDPSKRGYCIWKDSRQFDRKRGLENDLTVSVVNSLIASPCSYCGEDRLKKTLDRIDNSKGHLQSNVVVACIRCNYLRRDMPYEAWMCIVPGVAKTRASGLFGQWTGEVRKENLSGTEPVSKTVRA